MNNKIKRTDNRRAMNNNTILLLMTVALFAVMYIAGCVVYADKGFARLQSFIDILKNNAGLICATCGMTAVMITGGMDLSIGSLQGLLGVLTAMMMVNGGFPII